MFTKPLLSFPLILTFLWLSSKLLSVTALPSEILVHHADLPNPPHTPQDTHSHLHPPETLTKRARPNGIALSSRRQEIVDGWETYYNPLEALFPSQSCASDLVDFYGWVTSLVENEARVGTQANEFELFNGNGVRIRMESNAVFEWGVVVRILEWVVSLGFLFLCFRFDFLKGLGSHV